MIREAAPIVLVTGATDGIGKAAAIELAKRGATVLVHGRSLEKAWRVKREISRLVVDPSCDIVIADFKDLSDVRRLGHEIQKNHPDINVLINNAGIYSKDYTVSRDGFEQSYQVNYLAPFLLTKLLIGQLKRSAPSRIINVTSVLHQYANEDFMGPLSQRKYSGHLAYANSKLALSMFTAELARRYGDQGVCAMHVHPGGVSTKLLRAGFTSIGIPPQVAGKSLARLALEAEYKDAHGMYFERQLLGVLAERPSQAHPNVYDKDLCETLWARTETALEETRESFRIHERYAG